MYVLYVCVCERVCECKSLAGNGHKLKSLSERGGGGVAGVKWEVDREMTRRK